MITKSCVNDSNFTEAIKKIECKISLYSEAFEQGLNLWNQTQVIPLKMAKKATIRNEDICRELMHGIDEMSSKIITEDESPLEQTTQYTQMRELKKQETTLETNIEHMVHRIQKLKSVKLEKQKSNFRRKLEVQRNFAKISKKLTATNFDYQGPNISGIMANGNSFQILDLNPSKLHEHHGTNYFWEQLSGLNTVTWLDIFDNENINAM